MPKFLIAFERQPHLSRAQCHDHLRHAHAALVTGVHEFSRHVRSYIQNFAIDDGPRGCGSAFDADGIAELSFDTTADFSRAFSEPRYLELIRPDERRFANLDRVLCVWAEETVHWDDGGDGPIKLFRFMAPRNGGCEVRSSVNWRDGYPQAIRNILDLRQQIRKYVQNWAVTGTEMAFSGTQSIIGVEELWLSSDTSVSEFVNIEQSSIDKSGILYEDVDLEQSHKFICRERIVISK